MINAVVNAIGTVFGAFLALALLLFLGVFWLFGAPFKVSDKSTNTVKTYRWFTLVKVAKKETK